VPDGHSRLACAAFRSLRIADAYDAAQRALAIEPENHDALLYGASAAADLERWDDCIRMARIAAESDVTDANAHRNLGRGLTARNQLEPALAHFNIGKAVAPGAPQLHFEAATVYRRLGRAAAAVECLETANRLSPNHAPTLINLTAAAIEAGRATVAYEALHALTTLQADAAEIGPLTRALVQLCQDPSSQPNLSGAIQTTDKVGPIRCDNCEAEIHANHDRDNLCAGCGAVLAEVPRGGTYKPCPHCGADGLVSCFSAKPALKGAFRCPYCRRGTITSDAPAAPP
jgi:tetratricopeptide (TPR) repeat protein